MELLLIKLLDIVTKEDPETGHIETKKTYLPTYLRRGDVEEVSPSMTSKGKLYNNLSIIKKYSGDMFTVIGNYKDIINKIEDLNKKRNNIQGYTSERKNKI